MSVSIRSCPGCESLILADTFQCPDCGHVFDEKKAEKLAGAELASAEMESPCLDCGASVRSGLVRCPDCGRFMRDDIKKKYDDLQASPQKVIYSEPTAREDYIPPRAGGASAPMGPVMDAMDAGDDDAGFELGSGAAVKEYAAEDGGGFELGRAGESTAAPAPSETDAKTEAARTVDDPRETTGGDDKPADGADANADSKSESTDEDKTAAADNNASAAPAAPDVDVDGLLNIARQDERDSSRRRSERRRKEKANRVVVPCPCGAWMRVREHQMGKTVRCRKCGKMLPIPKLFKKKKESGEAPKKEVKLPWMNDVDHVTVDPANLKLKAGSVSGDASPVDILMSEMGIAICTLVAAKAKSGGLFGSKSKGADPRDDKRASIKAFLEGGGSISAAPSEKTLFIPADKIDELLIVQPVKKAHESMFAGVPVFGEGRIAIRIPASDAGTEQQFLSFGLTAFRFFAAQLSRFYDVADFGKDQGVPQADQKTALKCHYTGLILNALADTTYYEADDHIEMTLLGRKCGACGIAVCEESRKKQKIGGASGRGLSRAKCPKCTGKFGNNSLYAFEVKSSAPKLDVEEEEEDLDSVLRTASADAAPASEPKPEDGSTDDSTSAEADAPAAE